MRCSGDGRSEIGEGGSVTYVYVCMNTRMCVVVDQESQGFLRRLVAQRSGFAAQLSVPSREFATQTDKSGKYSFRMRSDRWMIMWHSNLIPRYENSIQQYKKMTIAADGHRLNNSHTHTIDIEYTILTYPA